MRIAIFGGSFNPPHLGHLKIIQELCQVPELDRLILSPAGLNPFKQENKVLPISLRAALLEASVQSLKQNHLPRSQLLHPSKLIVDWFEAYQPGKSFSLHLVHRLQQAYPKAKFAWVLGEDALAKIESWFEREQFLRQVDLWVIQRQGFTLEDSPFLRKLCPSAAIFDPKDSNDALNPAGGRNWLKTQSEVSLEERGEQVFPGQAGYRLADIYQGLDCYPTIYGKRLCYLPFQIQQLESSKLFQHFLTAPNPASLKELAAYMPEAALEAWQIWWREQPSQALK